MIDANDPTSRRTFLSSHPFLLGCAVGSGPIFAVQLMLVLGFGGWRSPGLGIFVAMLALPVALFSSAFLVLPKARSAAAAVSAGALGLFIGIVAAEGVAARTRMPAFVRASHRAQPVVVAVERFTEHSGHAPASLRDLVPGFLAEMPGRIPPLQIRSDGLYPPNPWYLESEASMGLLNWDRLLYFPHQNYGDFTGEGCIEPLPTGWGYLHE